MKKLIKSILTRNYQAEYQDKLAFFYFKSCHKIIDIGCGKGRFIKLDPKRISGIDSNKNTVKKALSEFDIILIDQRINIQ